MFHIYHNLALIERYMNTHPPSLRTEGVSGSSGTRRRNPYARPVVAGSALPSLAAGPWPQVFPLHPLSLAYPAKVGRLIIKLQGEHQLIRGLRSGIPPGAVTAAAFAARSGLRRAAQAPSPCRFVRLLRLRSGGGAPFPASSAWGVQNMNARLPPLEANRIMRHNLS